MGRDSHGPRRRYGRPARLGRPRRTDRSVGSHCRALAAWRVRRHLDPDTITAAELGGYMTGVRQNGGVVTTTEPDISKNPLDKILTPSQSPQLQTAIVTVAASLLGVLIALGISAFILAVTGKNPVDAFTTIVETAGNTDKLVEMLDRATPLIFSATAVAIGFKMNLFNIGVEGQYLWALLFDLGPGWKQRESAGADPCAVHPDCGRVRRGRMGVHRRSAEGLQEHPRGDLDDHAQLHRPRRDPVAVRVLLPRRNRGQPQRQDQALAQQRSYADHHRWSIEHGLLLWLCW